MVKIIDSKFDRNRNIVPHFKWREFIRDVDAIPPKEILQNLVKLAYALERLRSVFINKPIRITSGYRTPAHNALIGGEPNSYHTKGMAVDIVIVGYRPSEIKKVLDSVWPGGLGTYPTFTHIDIRPYRSRWIHK